MSAGLLKSRFQPSMLALSMVACGDREDFLQFLGILPSLREGKMPRNCKRESCRGSASARTRLLRSPESSRPYIWLFSCMCDTLSSRKDGTHGFVRIGEYSYD